MVGTSVILLVIFFSIYVAPKFQEIFKDFRTTLPHATQVLFNIDHVLVEDTYIERPSSSLGSPVHFHRHRLAAQSPRSCRAR